MVDGPTKCLPARDPRRVTSLSLLILLVGSLTTTALITDIRSDEGREYHAYKDLGGVVSICDGDTHGVEMGDVATDEQCDERTAKQLLAHARNVTRCAPSLLEVGRENQLRAFTRMDYNTGAFCRGWFKKRPAPAALVRSGDVTAACDELLRYDLVKGKPIRGLTRRRHRERELCVTDLVADATEQNLAARLKAWR